MGLERERPLLLFEALVRRNLVSGGGRGWNFSDLLGLDEMLGFEDDLVMFILYCSRNNEGEMAKDWIFLPPSSSSSSSSCCCRVSLKRRKKDSQGLSTDMGGFTYTNGLVVSHPLPSVF